MIRRADTACSGCGSHSAQVLFRGREHEYENTTDEWFDVVRCSSCGLVRLNPRPDVSELETIYPPSYYAYHLVSSEEPRGVSALVQGLKRRMYQNRFAVILARAALRERDPIRLLDVGCADGRLLDWYRSGSWGSRLETHGIDMSPHAVEVARRRGHRVVLGRFEEQDELEPASFDLILSNHVIEHVANPRAFLERSFELLAPGGLCVLETPNFDSVDVARFGRHWGGCHFPRHWTFYDAASMKRAAGSVGFELEAVEYQANPIFWNWTFHSKLAERSRKVADRLFPPVGIFHPSLQSFVLLSVFTATDLVLKVVTGKTSSMAVSLRKPAPPPCGAGG